MAINEKLSDRVRKSMEGQTDVEEKKMFGGLCFMVNGKMCICIRQDEIMCRIDPESIESILSKKKARQMIHNGHLMKGFVFVKEEDIKTKKEIEYWIQLSLEYNKKSPPAKKKTKKTSLKIPFKKKKI
ncbi:TfoX/Sxy family protein [Leptospira sp. 2 VSF19]|uniref:TfoX/Sxy family protein n=1 Tax=Leptospira soteropolitanensis TaxID=2950025 RepID=A0AAW5VSV3_9LEPT|nr:TfoX/Sxy family protein [Leptospira soteropolitanensis]MCW7494412.1 TfoX/Sxy family protein [Leptospira soteropolitanensis]MCW7502007.1 TfoX/Sxy family protein [Leptospira soteropolitanensis]MCW7524258.1 TfoX/Sxy family protein [Leptospira soteropolitanensis]MCW7528123.1 TfoX/Sxy family protein [Leptospira soteropolitanensis]MCW7531977.1 TfoX/Sxy family protein [Leptospira soteropolitanensis]